MEVRMPANPEDRFGMTLSTSSTAAAECFQDGVDRLLSQNHGPELKFQEAIELDEGFAMAYGCLAFWYLQRARPEEARKTIKQALGLASDVKRGVTRRERQQIEAVSRWINGKGPDSIALIKEHLAEFHRDGLLLRLAHRLYMQGCSGAGSPNFPPEYLALLQGVEAYCMDDWAFLAEYAFAHHETGQLDAAMDLAQRSLDINPINAVACHSMTHVHFERGDAASGEDFLGGWLRGFDAPASSYVHLSWHLALFELAQGKYQETLDRYENFIRPSVVDKSLSTLNDSASLMWRLQLYGGTPPPKKSSPLAASPRSDVKRGVTRRERQQIEAVSRWINGKGPDSIALIKEHLAEFHRDGLLLRLAIPWVRGGIPQPGTPSTGGRKRRVVIDQGLLMIESAHQLPLMVSLSNHKRWPVNRLL